MSPVTSVEFAGRLTVNVPAVEGTAFRFLSVMLIGTRLPMPFSDGVRVAVVERVAEQRVAGGVDEVAGRASVTNEPARVRNGWPFGSETIRKPLPWMPRSVGEVV